MNRIIGLFIINIFLLFSFILFAPCIQIVLDNSEKLVYFYRLFSLRTQLFDLFFNTLISSRNKSVNIYAKAKPMQLVKRTNFFKNVKPDTYIKNLFLKISGANILDDWKYLIYNKEIKSIQKRFISQQKLN